MVRHQKIFWTVVYLLMATSVSNAYTASEKTHIQSFLNQVFANNVPTPQRLWVTAELKTSLSQVRQLPPTKLSYRYWQKDTTVVWVLDEIGKERDITTGIVIQDNQIRQVKVLVYRESKGGEVQVPWFTAQFQGLSHDHNWSNEIDGISGATLSVNALKIQAATALLLNRQLL